MKLPWIRQPISPGAAPFWQSVSGLPRPKWGDHKLAAAGRKRRARAGRPVGSRTYDQAKVGPPTGLGEHCDECAVSRRYRRSSGNIDVPRDSTRGPLRVDVACQRGEGWRGARGARLALVIRREAGSPKTLEFTRRRRPCGYARRRCRGIAIGSSAVSKMAGVSAASPIIRRRVGAPGIIMSPWSCWRRCLSPSDAPLTPGPRIAFCARHRRHAQREAATQTTRQGALVRQLNDRHRRRPDAIASRLRNQQRRGPS
jgi:hypothetical protein